MKQYGESEDSNTTGKINEFEEDMKDLNEWQENQYNPGYYVGTGRVPRPVGQLGKSPVFLIFTGIIILLPTIASLVRLDYSNPEIVFSHIISTLVPLMLSIIFLYSGLKRWAAKRKDTR
jgi:hypothetical protein